MTTGYRFDRTTLLGPAIALAVVLFLAVYAMATALVGDRRIDLTEQRLYTLSEGTKTTLAGIREPVRLRLYLSDALTEAAPNLRAYADRVQQMLRTYVALSGERIRLEVINPRPFSPEEDRAVAFGLRGAAVNAAGDRGFFGLAGTNSTGDQQVIEFFAPEREPFLEYDLTRLVIALADPGKPVVAMIDGLGLSGSMQNRFQAQQVMDQFRQFFDVRLLGGDLAEVGAEVKVLVLVNPQNLSDATLYAIDQFVLRGGRTLVFVDPLAETQEGMRPGQPPPNPRSDLPRLFKAWGVTFDAQKIVADRGYAMQVQAMAGNRPIVVNYVPWLQLRDGALSTADVVTARIPSLNLTAAGAFALAEGATATLTPLVSSSADAMLMDATRVQDGGDPRALVRDFQPAGSPFVLAGRLRGTVATAFPDGRPEGAPKPETETPHLATSSAPANVILVGDADMLSDRNWIDVRPMMGQRVGVPFAGNADFAVNAIDNLAGGEALLSLRGRGLSQRPFEVVRELEAQAEARFRQTEQELTQRLRDAEERMQQIGRGQRTGTDGQVILTPEQQQEIERFRADMLQTRAELRDVQHALRQDIDQLKNRLTLLNVAAVPALVIVIAILAALFRPTRRPPPPPAGMAAA
jgi:ABC-type uncharacterized transport system involved in gliding motility auxiliary subunit